MQWLTICCTCIGEHCPLVIRFNIHGNPKGGLIEGNVDCWYNLFRWSCDHLRTQPEKKLLQHWNVRGRKFGTKNVGIDTVRKALNDMGSYSRSISDIESPQLCYIIRVRFSFNLHRVFTHSM